MSKSFYRVASLVWALVILILTLTPPPKDGPETMEGTDKLIHIGIFGVLSFLACGALPKSYRLVLIFSIVYGGTRSFSSPGSQSTRVINSNLSLLSLKLPSDLWTVTVH